LDGPGFDPQAAEAAKRNAEIVSHPSNIEITAVTTPPSTSFVENLRGNPIVVAAQEYSTCQIVVTSAIRKVEDLQQELKNAERARDEAISDRQIKKRVLEKLVDTESNQ